MKTNRAVRFVAAGIVVLTLLALPGFGVDYVWTNTAGGDYAVPGNWNPAGPPSTADNAIFNSNAAYSVSIPSPFTNAIVAVQQGDVNFTAGSAYFQATDIQIGTQRQKNATFTMNATIGRATNSIYVGNDGADGAKGVLNMRAGARLSYFTRMVVGNYNNPYCVTGIVDLSASSISSASNAPLYVSYTGVGELYVTNGSWVDCSTLYMNQSKGKTNYPCISKVVIGGPGPLSTLFVRNVIAGNEVGTFPNGYKYRREPITAEIIINTNGLLYQYDGTPTLKAGFTLTLAGGEFLENQRDIWCTGSVVRGTGFIRNGPAYTGKVVSLQKSAGFCDWPWSTTWLTNVAVMAPGMPSPGNPIGQIELLNWKWGGLEVRPECRLEFDLAGPAVGQYDRILATNGAVWFGMKANPGTGGAVINVALTNNFVPSNGHTFDVLVCTNIIEADLSLVNFNWPAQPANITWSASIITNIVPGYTNETLRLRASGGRLPGTVFMVK